MGLLSFPYDVLVRILHFIDLDERLSSCSRVCSKFKHAAAEATADINICFDQYDDWCSTQMMSWLILYGSSVTSLRLENIHHTFKDLPCVNLVELVLEEQATVQLHEGDGASGLVSCCPGLTKLCLVRCDWLGGQAGVEALSRLVHLQHLELIAFCKPSGRLGVPDSFYTLQQLTHLELRGSFDVADSFVLQVSSMSKLQSLAFNGSMWSAHGEPLVTAAGLANLHRLPHLEHIAIHVRDVEFNSSNTPSISQLTKLTSLAISNYGQQQLEPSVLAPLTNLLRLKLDGVALSSGTAFLTLLSTLQRLQEVRLNNPDQEGDVYVAWPRATSPLFTVFANVPDLRVLQLSWCHSLPAGFWQLIFPAERQLMALTELEICWQICDHEIDMELPEALLRSADLARIIKCCPNLKSLHADIEQGVQVADLAQLSRLTGLQQLELEVEDPGVCIEGLMCLTTLTDLTRLNCWYVLPDGKRRLVILTNEADPDQPPDVWQQLQQHCSQISPYLQPSTAASQQLVQQGQQIEHLQQQVEVLQRQLATEEQKAQGLEQAMVVMSAAHAAELSQLRSLVAQLQTAQQQH